MERSWIVNRVIRFRRAHFKNGKFYKFSYWGPVEGGFEGPTSITGCDSYIDEQFTGLHDKNGKEIYENDFIKADSFDKKMLVVWRKDLSSFALSADGWMYDHYFGEGADPRYCIITGNIHEN